MRRILSLRRAWSVRLVGSMLFALGAATLAQAANTSGGKLPTTNEPPEPGSALTYTPSLQPSDQASLGSTGFRTIEGTTFVVSAGPWAPQALYAKLRENGLDPTTGSRLIVRVDDAHPPTRITWSSEPTRQATLWLDAWPGSAFSRMPDRTIAHQLGLLWTAHHVQPSFWPHYLRARGIAGDPRLGSGTVWKREEILADDYRLLFGSAAAIAQYPRHMNRALRDPRWVPGLRDFLIDSVSR